MQVVQYIRLVKPDDLTQSFGSGFYTTEGRTYYWYSASGFGEDLEDGHGTHTAGSAAGVTLNNPADTTTCATDHLGCMGDCLSDTEVLTLPVDDVLDWDTLCPEFDCDGWGDPCLGDDVSQTLTDNGGVARGAKVSVFDASVDGTHVWGSLALNGLWNSTAGTGCVLHSNSWGGDGDCYVDSESATYDQYMYEVSVFVGGFEAEYVRGAPTLPGPT